MYKWYCNGIVNGDREVACRMDLSEVHKHMHIGGGWGWERVHYIKVRLSETELILDLVSISTFEDYLEFLETGEKKNG